MREKIARALFRIELPETATWESATGLMKDGFLAAADAVLDAMREPTDNMIEVGFDVSLDGKEWGKQTDICGIWRAMLDAAKEMP
jgi:hypothetical protein